MGEIFEELDSAPSVGRGKWKNETVEKDLKKLKTGKIYRARAGELWDRWHGGARTKYWFWQLTKKINDTMGMKVASYYTSETGEKIIVINLKS